MASLGTCVDLMTLTATRRWSELCWASKTVPMPPRPISRTMRQPPLQLPAAISRPDVVWLMIPGSQEFPGIYHRRNELVGPGESARHLPEVEPGDGLAAGHAAMHSGTIHFMDTCK